jgi:hypothetical protein
VTATAAGYAFERSGSRIVVNRFFRRLERFGKSFSARRSQGEMANTERDVYKANTPPDVTSTRAKSSGHGKKTADKWNQ